jgi:aryl-alcohol dehydrogenase-like predicted oxidoreductase
MIYRRLGRTELKVSAIGIGTWQFGGEWGRTFTQTEADAILTAGAEVGINLVDTAECYGDHLAESLIGNTLRGRRSRWIVATKFGHRYMGIFRRELSWTPVEVERQLEASLRALQTDYVDLYQFHSGSDQSFDHAELWEMLRRQVAAGKIRHVALSVSPNTNSYQVRRAEWAGIESVQIVYNRLDRAPEGEVLPACRELDLGVIARVPLASGLLSGKYRSGHFFTDEADIRSTRDPGQIQAQLDEVERLARAEVPAGMAMDQWALGWVLSQDGVTAAIPGCKTPEQVRRNAAAAGLLDG